MFKLDQSTHLYAAIWLWLSIIKSPLPAYCKEFYPIFSAIIVSCASFSKQGPLHMHINVYRYNYWWRWLLPSWRWVVHVRLGRNYGICKIVNVLLCKLWVILGNYVTDKTSLNYAFLIIRSRISYPCIWCLYPEEKTNIL